MSLLTLSSDQQALLSTLDNGVDEARLNELLAQIAPDEIELVALLEACNALYRGGYPVLNDAQYDTYHAQLAALAPEHPFLHHVEEEAVAEAKTVALPQRMLSTEKAYSKSEIDKWLKRILKAADELSIDLSTVALRVTPKLDGYAAFDDGSTLYTRGDGTRGQDITRAFLRGLQVADSAGRGLGAGEIVIKKSYFDRVLSEHFENSRNIQAAIIAEKKVDENIQQAIDDGACVFFPFVQLPNVTGHYSEIMAKFEEIVEQMWNSVDFDIDGIILEATDEAIKAHMGATRRNHRWQIAFKVNEASAQVRVLRVVPQTSRTGRISPVAELEPTKLSGATISRVTVHHYNMVKTNGVGPDAIVELVRSGLVIPKIERVIKAATPEIPSECPSCGAHLLWESDHLICPNKSACPAQTENTLVHFFKTLGNNDGFGPKVIEKLTARGIKRIHDVYGLTPEHFASFGFGEKTSQNLAAQLSASREIQIEDWRFLSAFGVSRLGGGNCEKLLEHHSLVELFDLSVEAMVSIDGFAELSAVAIVEGLANIRDEFFAVYSLGFNLAPTKQEGGSGGNSPIAGKTIVFTGSMQQGKRGDMEKQAKAMGAKVAKSVSAKTDYLVTGEKVGATKISAAAEKGVEVMTEDAYLQLISGY